MDAIGRHADEVVERSGASSSRCSGGAAAAWPLAVHAQQPNRARRIGVLMGTRLE